MTVYIDIDLALLFKLTFLDCINENSICPQLVVDCGTVKLHFLYWVSLLHAECLALGQADYHIAPVQEDVACGCSALHPYGGRAHGSDFGVPQPVEPSCTYAIQCSCGS